jgi:hypothetical protein
MCFDDRDFCRQSPHEAFDLDRFFSGIRFFRTRINSLLEQMIDLKIEHFAATMLHPRYRHLKRCSSDEITRCKKFILREMHAIAQISRINHSTAPHKSHDGQSPPKKKKRFSEQFESGNVSDEYDDHEEDELNRYLSMRLDFDKINHNPLSFWREQVNMFPTLSSLARRLHSIPATTASVERTFSGGGQVVTERRTNLSPSQVDNVLFIRSMLSNDEAF